MPSNHKVLTRQGYILEKKKLTKQELSQIKSDLEVVPESNPDYTVDPGDFIVYTETDKTICIPRYYGIKKFGPPDKVVPMDTNKMNIKFNTDLRDIQKPIVEKCLATIKENGGGIISLPCGFGKTVIGLYIAQKLGLKTLVVVHKTFLQNQWYERIKQFTNAKIGMIRQNKVDIEGKDIVIAMLQSISMRDYDPSVFDQFSTIIFDEVHHLAAKVFSRSMMKTGGHYTIGLSATPDRNDGLMKVVNWYIGDIIYQMTRKGDKNVVVKMFNYNTKSSLFVEKKQRIKGKTVLSMPRMITNIGKIPGRNKFIIDIINKLRNEDERKILVLSNRIAHLELLKSEIDKIIETDVNFGKLEPNEIKTGFYIGKMKEYELTDSAEADIIFGSYAMAEEGLDIDKLNTLILATPKKNVVQSIGRILRKPIKEGDINPLIIDVVDEFSIFTTWGRKRQEYYTKSDYTIETFQAWKDKCISMKDYLIQNGAITPDQKDINLRKEYICFKFGEEAWELEQDLLSLDDNKQDTDDNDQKMYNYEPSLDVVLKVDMDFKDVPMENIEGILLNNIEKDEKLITNGKDDKKTSSEKKPTNITRKSATKNKKRVVKNDR